VVSQRLKDEEKKLLLLSCLVGVAVAAVVVIAFGIRISVLPVVGLVLLCPLMMIVMMRMMMPGGDRRAGPKAVPDTPRRDDKIPAA